jgi:KaiC/GvpD/RAD55 family RecA-like ATPase
MDLVERVESGIPGLDKLMEGGFVKGSVNLVVGTTGTCKTTFCSQFLWHGIQRGEPGVYITVEQEAENILSDVLRYGFNFRDCIDRNMCIFLDLLPSSFDELEKATFDCITKIGAKRFVLDSLSVVMMSLKEEKDPSKLRRKVFRFTKRLRSMGVTSLLVNEIPETQPKALTRFGFEEFVADGIIVLYYLEYGTGSKTRSLIIRKMRRTNHGTDIYPFEITSNGIVVKS